MQLYLYNSIIETLESFSEDNWNWLEELSKAFPEVKKSTLRSIYIQWTQNNVINSYHFHINPTNIKKYYQQYTQCMANGDSPGIILRMAQQKNFSAAILVKAILDHYLCLAKENGIELNFQVNNLMKDTTLIEDKDLSYEVYLCLLHDDVYGPFSEYFNHSIGFEFEYDLKRQLQALDVFFEDEDVMRSSGYDKTPDVRLNVPIAVDGQVINWIESKAMFGDKKIHKRYLNKQLWSYWNRFGPGLIIYWFGFIDDLDEHAEKGILIRDHLPTNITQMDSLAV